MFLCVVCYVTGVLPTGCSQQNYLSIHHMHHDCHHTKPTVKNDVMLAYVTVYRLISHALCPVKRHRGVLLVACVLYNMFSHLIIRKLLKCGSDSIADSDSHRRGVLFLSDSARTKAAKVFDPELYCQELSYEWSCYCNVLKLARIPWCDHFRWLHTTSNPHSVPASSKVPQPTSHT